MDNWLILMLMNEPGNFGRIPSLGLFSFNQYLQINLSHFAHLIIHRHIYTYIELVTENLFGSSVPSSVIYLFAAAADIGESF